MSDIKICPDCGSEMEKGLGTTDDGKNEFVIYDCLDCGNFFIPNSELEKITGDKRDSD